MRSKWWTLAVFVLLAVAMTWPVADQLGTHLPGGADDVWVHQWTFWWVKRAIVQGLDPLQTDLLFHPHGVSLASHNIAWLNIAAWLPLQAIVGSNTAYSVLFIATVVLNGFAMYLLARDVTGAPAAAFVGGIVFGFWPYTLSHYGHPNMMLTGWMPLALLHLRRTLAEKRTRDALLAGLFLGLTGLTRWQLLIMGSVIVGLYLIYRCLTDKACRTRRTLRLLALGALVAAAVMAPLAGPVAVRMAASAPEQTLGGSATTRQTDLLAYVVPFRNHPLWSDAAARAFDHFGDNRVYIAFAGYMTLALGLWGTVQRWKHARVWLLAAVAIVLLALGPQVRVNGRVYPFIPMPYRIVASSWIGSLLRNPDRFNVLLGLPLGMLASLGTAALLPHHYATRRRFILAAALGIVILREYSLTPYPTVQPATPAWYRQVTAEAGDYAILDAPMRPETFDKHYMLYQTVHEKPLVEGHVSRRPPALFTFIEGNALTRAFAAQAPLGDQADVDAELRRLAGADVRYVVLHKPFLSAELEADWTAALATRPIYEDDELIVFVTEPEPGVHYGTWHDFGDVLLSQGWIERGQAPTLVSQWAVDEPQTITVTLRAPDGSEVASQELAVEQSLSRPLHTPLPTTQLSPGEYRVTLSGGGETFALPARLVITPDGWYPTRLPLDTVWEEAIALRGIDYHRLANTLTIDLQWEARRPIEDDRKFFVHLQSEDGTLVAQYDGMPQEWAHPTSRWTTGEWIADRVAIPLRDVPAGTYHLAVGWYEPETGRRLAGVDAAGAPLPEQTLLVESAVSIP